MKTLWFPSLFSDCVFTNQVHCHDALVASSFGWNQSMLNPEQCWSSKTLENHQDFGANQHYSLVNVDITTENNSPMSVAIFKSHYMSFPEAIPQKPGWTQQPVPWALACPGPSGSMPPPWLKTWALTCPAWTGMYQGLEQDGYMVNISMYIYIYI